MSLTLKQKLEMIKISEEGVSKAKISWRLGFLHQRVTKNKKKILEGNLKWYSSEHMNDKKGKQLCFWHKVLVVWLDDQISYNISLGQNQIQKKALTFFNSVKTERGEEAAQEKLEASRGQLIRFKKYMPFP